MAEREMPAVGIGTACSAAASSDVGDAVATALGMGFRSIDCAPLYGNQAEIGTAAFSELSMSQRQKLWITSKLWVTHFAEQHVRPACVHTLAELRVEYLDLYLMHAPTSLAFNGIPPSDPTPRDEDGNARASGVPHAVTWRAMEALVSEGMVRYIGVSNFSLEELDELMAVAQIQPYCNQVELHPLCQQSQLVEGCIARGVHPVGFSPLGKGRLLNEPILQDIAKRHGVSVASVCIQWNLQRGVTVIPQTLSAVEMGENLGLLTSPSFSLSEFDMNIIRQLDRSQRMLVLDWGSTYPGPLLALKLIVPDDEPLGSPSTIDWSGVQQQQPALTKLPAVLFLDVDGVLHTVVAGDTVQTAADLDRLLTAAEALKAVIGSGISVVLSSTWRHGFEHAADRMVVCATEGSMRKLKCEHLHKLLQARLVSKTPRHSEHDRSAEILAWVDRFQPQAWVAVDDEIQNLAGLPEAHSVLIDGGRGLTMDKANEIKERLEAAVAAQS